MIRTRMDREERAKQFIPFSPLKGYEEALREKEKTVVPRIWGIRPPRSGRNTQAKAVRGETAGNKAVYRIQDGR